MSTFASRLWRTLWGATLPVLLLAACGDATPTVTPTASSTTAAPTVSSTATPSSTPTASSTPPPTVLQTYTLFFPWTPQS